MEVIDYIQQNSPTLNAYLTPRKRSRKISVDRLVTDLYQLYDLVTEQKLYGFYYEEHEDMIRKLADITNKLSPTGKDYRIHYLNTLFAEMSNQDTAYYESQCYRLDPNYIPDVEPWWK